MADKPKVNLSMMRKLVSAIEESIACAEKIGDSVTATPADYILEMSKAQGLTSTLVKEATYLVMDMETLIRLTQAPMSEKGADKPSPSKDILEKILGMNPNGKGGNFGGQN